MEGDVTIDDILDELAACCSANERQPGDVDAGQLAERMGISKRRAQYRMEDIGQSVEWDRLKVFDPETRVYRWVLRKVKP